VHAFCTNLTNQSAIPEFDNEECLIEGILLLVIGGHVVEDYHPIAAAS
jgi:hypothetical protein